MSPPLWIGDSGTSRPCSSAGSEVRSVQASALRDRRSFWGVTPSGSVVLGGIEFTLVGELDPDRDADGEPLEFMPQAAYAKAATTKLNPHGDGPFCRVRIAQRVREPGLYAVMAGDEVRYIGMADDLAERWGPRGYGAIHPRNCYVGGQATNCKINSAILREAKAGGRLFLYFAPLSEGRRQVESRLVSALRPPLNGRQS
jgi:hypothetical protein